MLAEKSNWKKSCHKLNNYTCLQICSCFGCHASFLQLHWNTQTGCAHMYTSTVDWWSHHFVGTYCW